MFGNEPFPNPKTHKRKALELASWTFSKRSGYTRKENFMEASKRITDYFVQEGTIKEVDQGLYVYYFDLLFVFFTNLFAILLISALLDVFLPTIFYMLGFWLIRVLAGGYHAKTPGSCFVITLLFYILFVLSLHLARLYLFPITFIMILVSTFVIFKFAPVECENKPFKKGQQRQLQKQCQITCFALVIAVFCMRFLGYTIFGYCIGFGMSVSAVSIVINLIAKFRLRR